MEKTLEKVKHRLIVPPGKKVKLARDFDPSWKPAKMTKEEAVRLLTDGVKTLAQYQEKLYAQDRWSILVIFQAMDAAGKDGTIKHVMSGLNPQGCQVHSFKAPSVEELDHDYLWRCVKALPERGRIGIFNRSYYEEVLIARVHKDVLDRQRIPEMYKDKKIWKRRFEHINALEQYMLENGTITLKFFLNVSKEEQKRRFLERIDTPEKNWKFSVSDARERGFWDDYMAAYEDCFNHTSTKVAPWYIIPADDKPFMRLAVAGILADTMKSMKLHFPKVTAEHQTQLLQARKMLESE